MIQRPRLLVIDDDPTFRKWLSHVLRTRFFVMEAAAGAEGYSRAMTAIPEVVLLDQEMEGWNGVETLRKFREHPKLANIPILMLTADATRDSVIKSVQAGATDYILKTTVTPKGLVEKLDTLLGRLLVT